MSAEKARRFRNPTFFVRGPVLLCNLNLAVLLLVLRFLLSNVLCCPLCVVCVTRYDGETYARVRVACCDALF